MSLNKISIYIETNTKKKQNRMFKTYTLMI